MVASAISITQATEAGTVYRPNEIAALSEIAHQRLVAGGRHRSPLFDHLVG